MKQDKILYGNITLSQIAHFLVDVCGKDALLAGNYLNDSELNDAYKEKGSYLKFRFTDENSIFGKIRQFFSDLEDEFGVPKIELTQNASLDGKQFEKTEQSAFQYFYRFIVWHCIIHIAGTRPFENTQNNVTKKSIATWLLLLGNDMLQKYIALWSDSSFTEIFSEFISHSGKTFLTANQGEINRVTLRDDCNRLWQSYYFISKGSHRTLIPNFLMHVDKTVGNKLIKTKPSYSNSTLVMPNKQC